ncbi:hypothetical protein [Nocardia sp. CC227C]|uniref:hypothetical protein n=1 Tax=Nocardia sp. CC227C TaxID=3044562 RepID=UPI00278BDA78|nr:hypothetical protein [Nocardia sp. CC227C]
MQRKTARGVVAALAVGAAFAAVPAAQAAPLTLEPYTAPAATPSEATPVGSIFDTNSASSLSSGTTSTLACFVQSISQQVQCIGGAE